ncbi:MAG TPA: chemotaxis protein CheW [Candidatus Limnocylindrales bacterium]|nr:chemotaxis protein CheW [Candidatus Limnocylindrales bacterium]
MRPATPNKSHSLRAEQIILFRASTQIFAVSSASVQEVRSVDSLAGAAVEINEASLAKVRHAIRRGDRNQYVVSAAVHFGLRPTPAALIFMLRKSRVALLVDGIERMTSMTRLQALPGAFCHEEREWYRGVTVLDQNVIPVVNPGAFLTAEEISYLDAVTGSQALPEVTGAPENGLNV